MCIITKNLHIQGVRIQGEDLKRGGKFRGVETPSSELCFGTSEMEWLYIMDTFLTLS